MASGFTGMTAYSILTTAVLLQLFKSAVVVGQVRPPNFSPDRLPETQFTCEDKVTGGYYADVEADCQLFHVCVQVSEYEFQDFHFLCPNDTVFDQQHLVCTNWFEVDCHAQLALVPLQFFTNDFGVRSNLEDEDVRPRVQEDNSFFGQSRLRNTGRGQVEVGRRRQNNNFRRTEDNLNSFDFQDIENREGPTPSPAINVTPIPLGFTTTIRPSTNGPVQPSGLLSGRNLKTLLQKDAEPEFTTESPVNRQPEESNIPFIPKLSRDGRRPKVKSNLKALRAHHGGNSNNHFEKASKFEQFNNKKANFQLHQERKRKKVVIPSEASPIAPAFDLGPEVRPDGRTARVKSDILAEIKNNPSAVQETTTFAPFIEAFFGSPSSPKPFIFTGTPDPYETDLFGSASTVKPFFLPTAKSAHGISQSPFSVTLNTEEDETAPTIQVPNDDFENDEDEQDEVHTTEVHIGARGRNHRFNHHAPNNFGRSRGASNFNQIRNNNQEQEFDSSENSIFDDEEEESTAEVEVPLSTPFRQRQRSGFLPLVSRQRPRVKSNIRARKRNFWQHQGANNQGAKTFDNTVVQKAARKFRRGRKQKLPEVNTAAVNKVEEGNRKETDFSFTDNTEATTTFVPTSLPEIEETTMTHVEDEVMTVKDEEMKEETSEVFEEEFDNFITASSTASPVVFKGSPTPNFGFFSSPSPFQHSGPRGSRPQFNNIGHDIDLGNKKVKPFVFVTSTESNKIFIGATEKPEMVEEETTISEPVTDPSTTATTTPLTSSTVLSKKPFPSFPLRSNFRKGSLAFPFRPNLVSTTTTTTTTTEEEVSSDDLETTIKPLAESTTRSGLFKPVKPFRFQTGLPSTGARRNLSRFFSRNLPGLSRPSVNKVEEPVEETPEDESNVDDEELTTLQPELEEENEPSTTIKPEARNPLIPSKPRFPLRPPVAGFLHPPPQLALPQGARLLSFSRSRGTKTTTTSTPPTTTTTPTPTLTTTTTTVNTPEEEVDFFDAENDLFVASSTVSSVVFKGTPTPGPFGFFSSPQPDFDKVGKSGWNASPLRGFHSPNARPSFSNIGNLINLGPSKPPAPTFVGEVDETTPHGTLSVESELFEDNVNAFEDENKKFPKKFLGVPKKASSPPNANIRVEFKKAVVPEPEPAEPAKKFFIKPDGRRPRVKANIRARIAHQGGSFQFAGNHHSANFFDDQAEENTGDDELRFNGDAHLQHADNTEKREIDPSVFNQVIQDEDEIVYNDWADFEEQVQQVQEGRPFAAAAESPVLPDLYEPRQEQVVHIDDHSAMTENKPANLLKQIMSTSSQDHLPNNVVVEQPPPPQQALPSQADQLNGVVLPPPVLPSIAAPQVSPALEPFPNLSAFKALMQHAEKNGQLSLQLLNPRDQQPEHSLRSDSGPAASSPLV